VFITTKGSTANRDILGATLTKSQHLYIYILQKLRVVFKALRDVR
jgi:hypothetical protein